MKVLVTGVTNQQAGRGTQLGYEPVADLFVKGLRHFGHDVVHGVSPIGQPLTEYDAVFVGVVPPLSVAGKYLYTALWTIAEAERTGLPLVLYLDDWAFPSLITKLGTCHRNPHHLIKPFFSNRHEYAWAQDHVNELSAVIERLYTSDWPPTVIPTFTWGDHSRLVKPLPHATEPWFIDPSSFARHYEVTTPNHRERRWVLGTVSDQRQWLESLQLGWPVHYIGSRSSKATEKLQEADLIQRYANNRGVLSPAYPRILGTGWWRNRFVYAARTRSVLLGDSRETSDLGGAYSLSAPEIEAMTGAQLYDLAAWQADELFKRQASADQSAEMLNLALSSAASRVA